MITDKTPQPEGYGVLLILSVESLLLVFLCCRDKAELVHLDLVDV